MLSSVLLTRLVLYSTLFVGSVVAQNDGRCGSNITFKGDYYEIRFTSYCSSRLTNSATQPPIPAFDFLDCSRACVTQGPTCGGFSFDRTSTYGSDNCYLNKAYSQPTFNASSVDNISFDSAVINNNSLPITRRDCTNIAASSSSQYVNYSFRCGEGIFDGSSYSNQLNKTFAASIGDCIDHCSQYNINTGYEICKAVTWDSSLLSGYQNCYMKGNYYNPVKVLGWDTATLVGTTGYSNTSTITSTSPTSNPSASSPSLNNPSSGSSGIGAVRIAGIVVGVVLAVLIVIVIILTIYFRNRKKRNEPARNEKMSPVGPQPPQTSQAPVLPPVTFYGPNNGKVIPREDKGKGKMRAIEKEEEQVVAGPSRVVYA